MAIETGSLIILNLRDGGAIRLLFPEQLESEDSANYSAVDISSGLKPLFFENREPGEIKLDDVLLDGTRGYISVEPEIEKLNKLLQPDSQTGAPPPLQIMANSWSRRCVLVTLRVNRTFFTPQGECIRALVSLTLKEIRGLTVPTGGRRLGGLAR